MQEREFQQKLVQRYAENKATGEELEAFFYLLKEGQLEGQLQKALDAEARKIPVASATIVHRVHFIKTAWFKYAAAILVITGIAISYWIINNTGNHKNHLTNLTALHTKDVQPGTNKAILTLASGKKIILDSAANGHLVQADGVEVTTPKGGQYQIVLPDGSKVWLNAASSIKFPTAFAQSERRVEVTGEAYFEISAQHQKHPQPFIVSTNGTEVQVLGTSFNINAYVNESSINTTLIDGSVQVVRGQNKVLLKPGQQAQVKSTAAISVAGNADIEKVLAWKNGLFNFDDASLSEVMKQLERWYDIEVIYEKGIPDKQFGGQMSKDISLAGLLEVLQTTGVHFRMEAGRRLIVLP